MRISWAAVVALSGFSTDGYSSLAFAPICTRRTPFGSSPIRASNPSDISSDNNNDGGGGEMVEGAARNSTSNGRMNTGSSADSRQNVVTSDLAKYHSILRARRSGGLLRMQQVSNAPSSPSSPLDYNSADRVSFSKVGAVGRGGQAQRQQTDGTTRSDKRASHRYKQQGTGTSGTAHADNGTATMNATQGASRVDKGTEAGGSIEQADETLKPSGKLPFKAQSQSPSSSSQSSSSASPVSWSRAVRSRDSLSPDETFLFMLEQYVLLVKGRLNMARLVTMNNRFNHDDCLPSGHETWIEHVEKTLGLTYELKQQIANMPGTSAQIVQILQPTVELLGKADELSPRATRVIKPRPKRKVVGRTTGDLNYPSSYDPMLTRRSSSKAAAKNNAATRFPPEWTETIPRPIYRGQLAVPPLTAPPMEQPAQVDEAPSVGNETVLATEPLVSSAPQTLLADEVSIASNTTATDVDLMMESEENITSTTRSVVKKPEKRASVPSQLSSPSSGVDEISSKPGVNGTLNEEENSMTDSDMDVSSQTGAAAVAAPKKKVPIPSPVSSPSLDANATLSKPRTVNGSPQKDSVASPPFPTPPEMDLTSKPLIGDKKTPVKTAESVNAGQGSIGSATAPVGERQDGEPIPAKFRFLGTKYMEELKRAASKNPLLLKDELEKLRVEDGDDKGGEVEDERLH